MFISKGDGVWQGRFKEVPSRSSEAFITLVLTRAEEAECFLSYNHHEGVDNFIGSRKELIAEFKEMADNQETEEWRQGLLDLIKALEDKFGEYYAH